MGAHSYQAGRQAGRQAGSCSSAANIGAVLYVVCKHLFALLLDIPFILLASLANDNIN